MTTTFTPHFRLELPDFDSSPWHDQMLRNFRALDGLLFTITGVTNIRGTWLNSTEYEDGDRVIDGDVGQAFVCAVTHVSAAYDTTFAEDRAAHPGYWTQINLIPTSRGNWATGTVYNVNDTVLYNNTIYYVCRVDHESGVFSEDLGEGKWAVILDLSAATDVALKGFETKYLGAKDAAPTTDNDGGELLLGALYYQATGGNAGMKVWTGTEWDDTYATGAGFASQSYVDGKAEVIQEQVDGIDEAVDLLVPAVSSLGGRVDDLESGATLDARYQERDEKNEAGGYAPLDGDKLIPDANQPARIRKFSADNIVTDYNSIASTGFGFAEDDAANRPVNEDCLFKSVFKDVNNGIVRAQGLTSGAVYRRAKAAGNWGSWELIHETESDLDTRYPSYESIDDEFAYVNAGNQSGDITPDFTTFLNWQFTLNGNATLKFPTESLATVVGRSGLIRILQDGTGNRTLSYQRTSDGADGYVFDGGSAITISYTANAKTMIGWHVISDELILLALVGKAVA